MPDRPISPLGHLRRQLSKKELAAYCALSLLLALSEAFGISMLFPILVFLQGGADGLTGGNIPAYLSWVLSIAPAMGLPVNLPTLLVMAFVPIALRQVFKMTIAIYNARVLEGTMARLRDHGFSSFMGTDLPFFANWEHGRMMSALNLQSQAGGELAAAMLTAAGSLIVLVVYLAMLLLISPLMTLIAVATGLVATSAVYFLISPVTKRTGQIFAVSQDQLSTSYSEGLSAIRMVKLLAQEQIFTRFAAATNESLRRAHLKLRVYQNATGAVVEPIFILGTFAVLYVGSEFLGVGLATLSILFLALIRLMPLAQSLNMSRNIYVGGSASLARYNETVEAALESSKLASGPLPFAGLSQGIEFNRVSFSYDPNNSDGWALRDITFQIPKGKMTAIVGRSGAGKSTMVDLIPRLRDPSIGEVLIDGVNVKELDLTDLRRSIGFLSQDTFMFNDTIHKNIAFGLPAATLEQVKEAAKRAYAHDFIEASPDGYNTIVGDRGVRLSAGQRQRLGIARVILQNPDIIILDEPTSALDSESENYIRIGLDEFRKEKTMIVIAHRLSTIQMADEILVLDDGRIVEQGNHSLLLDRDGDYRRLFELQIHA